jgi:hypothetical protein
LLKGLIFGPTGAAMTPTHSRRSYRYYTSTNVLKQDASACPIKRIPAGEIERAVVDQIRKLIQTPVIIVRTWKAARQRDPKITEHDVREALDRFDPLWDELLPAEQARIVQLLVERIDVTLDGIDIRLRVEGLTELVRDLSADAQGSESGADTRRAA